MMDPINMEDEANEKSDKRDSLLNSSKMMSFDYNASASTMPDFSSSEIQDESGSTLHARHVRFSQENIKSPPAIRRSILKSTLKPAEIEAILVQREKRQAMLDKMKEGTVLWKYSHESKCEKRTFCISKDETEMMWKHIGKISSIKTTRIPFASVKNIVYGPRTPGFKSFDWKVGKSWLCFSVVCEGRNVDIECPDLETFELWFFGIQQLAPLSHKFLTPSQVNWKRALYKTAQVSLVCELPLEDVWHELVRLSRSPAGTEPCTGVFKDKLIQLQAQEGEQIELKHD